MKLGLWWRLEVPDCGVWHFDLDVDMVFDTSMIRILALYLDFEGAKKSMSFKSSFGALEDA